MTPPQTLVRPQHRWFPTASSFLHEMVCQFHGWLTKPRGVQILNYTIIIEGRNPTAHVCSATFLECLHSAVLTFLECLNFFAAAWKASSHSSVSFAFSCIWKKKKKDTVQKENRELLPVTKKVTEAPIRRNGYVLQRNALGGRESRLTDKKAWCRQGIYSQHLGNMNYLDRYMKST